MLNPHTPTMPSAAEPASFAFGRFIMHPRHRRLRADEKMVELGSRAFDVLLMLVENAGDLVTKDAILDRVWPNVAVEENNLPVQISALRRVLGPQRDWIVTIPGRGYRFTADVTTPPPALGEESAVIRGSPAEPRGLPNLSLLVLPLANRSADPARDWFADGITDSLTTDLARALPGTAVIAHTSAEAYRGQPMDVRAIGRDQGVRYVLEGSALPTGDRVRINAQLIDAETGTHVWAERFDVTQHDVLQAQDEIVGRLGRAVGLEMIAAEARRAERAEREGSGGGTTQDYVLRGRAATNQRMMTGASMEDGCALYARALDRDPENADALAGIAYLRVCQVMIGHCDTGRTVGENSGREAHLAEAEDKLARAFAAAPDHLAALKGRAVLLKARGAFEDALATAETVIARNPGDPMIFHEIASSLMYLGRLEEAVKWFERADALAPRDPLRWTWLQGRGRALVQLGRDAEAASALRLAVVNNPNFAPSYAFLAAALVLAGENTPAQKAMSMFRSIDPAVPLEAVARCSAVPFAAADPLYKLQNDRVLKGLDRACRLA